MQYGTVTESKKVSAKGTATNTIALPLTMTTLSGSYTALNPVFIPSISIGTTITVEVKNMNMESQATYTGGKWICVGYA